MAAFLHHAQPWQETTVWITSKLKEKKDWKKAKQGGFQARLKYKEGESRRAVFREVKFR